MKIIVEMDEVGLTQNDIESFHRSNQFHFAVFWSIECYKFWKKKFRKKIEDARNNLIDMHKLSLGIF